MCARFLQRLRPDRPPPGPELVSPGAERRSGIEGATARHADQGIRSTAPSDASTPTSRRSEESDGAAPGGRGVGDWTRNRAQAVSCLAPYHRPGRVFQPEQDGRCGPLRCARPPVGRFRGSGCRAWALPRRRSSLDRVVAGKWLWHAHDNPVTNCDHGVVRIGRHSQSVDGSVSGPTVRQRAG